MQLQEALSELLSDRLYQITISGPKRSDGPEKIKIRPVLKKGELCFQETITRGTQVFHENHDREEILKKIMLYMEDFKQLQGESMDLKLTALVSKKGKTTVKSQRIVQDKANAGPELSHNRVKNYILKEGVPVPFLVDLGVQTPEGKIIHAKYDKFKQINRYLEFVEDVLPTLPKERTLHIIDFGCGKSYLTFALYYYLNELKKRDAVITGLDLKTDVIKKCSQLAKAYGYEKLRFLQGDISTFQGERAAGAASEEAAQGAAQEEEKVDMVVTLHACDTATDYAIFKAIQWKADVIFTVPCCQHEVNRQLQSEELEPVLKYGILKERIAALLTDGIRASLLEEAGYDTQVLEFIDMEHTPKNLLIRAVKRKNEGAAAQRDTGIGELARQLHVDTTLQKLIRE